MALGTDDQTEMSAAEKSIITELSQTVGGLHPIVCRASLVFLECDVLVK